MNNFFYLVLLLAFFSCSKDYNSKQLKDQPVSSAESSLKLDIRTIQNLLNKTGFETKIDSESHARFGKCGPELPAGVNCTSFESEGVISVPPNGNTPGCNNTTVSFTTSICFDQMGNLVSIHLSNFDAYPDPMGCDELWNYWNNRSGEELGFSVDAFIYRASLIVEAGVVSVLMGNNYPCPSNYVLSTFSKDLCYQQCLTSIKEFPFIKIEYSHCGLVCCERSTQWCKDVDGNPTSSEPVFVQIGDFGDCGDNPLGLCKGVPISSCEHICGPIVELMK